MAQLKIDTTSASMHLVHGSRIENKKYCWLMQYFSMTQDAPTSDTWG